MITKSEFMSKNECKIRIFMKKWPQKVNFQTKTTLNGKFMGKNNCKKFSQRVKIIAKNGINWRNYYKTEFMCKIVT
jgi:hypothetical protein